MYYLSIWFIPGDEIGWSFENTLRSNFQRLIKENGDEDGDNPDDAAKKKKKRSKSAKKKK